MASNDMDRGMDIIDRMAADGVEPDDLTEQVRCVGVGGWVWGGGQGARGQQGGPGRGARRGAAAAGGQWCCACRTGGSSALTPAPAPAAGGVDQAVAAVVPQKGYVGACGRRAVDGSGCRWRQPHRGLCTGDGGGTLSRVRLQACCCAATRVVDTWNLNSLSHFTVPCCPCNAARSLEIASMKRKADGESPGASGRAAKFVARLKTLNTQFANYVREQEANHLGELWIDGVEDYQNHVNQLLAEYLGAQQPGEHRAAAVGLQGRLAPRSHLMQTKPHFTHTPLAAPAPPCSRGGNTCTCCQQLGCKHKHHSRGRTVRQHSSGSSPHCPDELQHPGWLRWPRWRRR